MSKDEKTVFIFGMVGGALALSILVQLFSFISGAIIKETSKELGNRPLFRIELVQK